MLDEPHARRREMPGVTAERRNEVMMFETSTVQSVAVDRMRFWCRYRPVVSRLVVSEPDPRRVLVSHYMHVLR